MRRVLVIAAVTALAVARPEMYKEKEDFQYSRSSSDDGSKSGFYGAQRGNMGGNYERAHNMDLLAQHQMGGLVKTVEGELGDGAKQRSGSVFSAANSRGIYGSGHYDLSNLEGRNFQESASLGNSQSHSSLSSHNTGYGSQAQSYSAAAENSAYDSNSHNSRFHRYHTTGNSDQALYANNMQSADNLQSASQYDGTQTAHSTGYHSQSGYQGQSGYDQSAANSQSSNAYGSNYRIVSASPVRVIVRPGGRVTIPIPAQTYDASQGSASTFNQNAINSEAEVLDSSDQQSAHRPTSNAKRYESSYSYRKEWEKHDTKPIAGAAIPVPTVNPYPSNSELYEDTQAQRSEHQHEVRGQEDRNVHSNSQYRGYNVKSASSSQSRQQAAYNAHEHSAASDTTGASSVADSSAYTHGAYNHDLSANLNAANLNAANLNAANLNNQVEDFGSKPKSYQSSYSYHKSWERQGDPYVIKPSTNGLYSNADTQTSQRLTASSLNQGASSYDSHQYGAHHHQSHQGYLNSNGVDCDENGHIRVARSYNVEQDQVPFQQSENIYEGQEDLSQQSQNLQDFSQQSQNSQDFGQLSQNLQDFGQQSQNLEDLGQQSQNLEDLGQQSQNLEDLGQQSQNLEDLGQQSQNLEDLGQQSLNLENLGQQSQNLENFGQQSQNLEDFGQQAQDIGQLTQSKADNLEHYGQQAHNEFDRIEDLGQQTQNKWDQQSQTDLGQQTQNTWSTLETTQKGNGDQNIDHQLNGMEQTGYNQHSTNTAFQTQDSVFEINHPSLHQPESHTTQDTNKLNPVAHTFFDVHLQDQEKTDLGNVENYFTQSEGTNAHTNQQTQNFWNNFQANMNENSQNVYSPILPLDLNRIRQERPDWQQYLDAYQIHLNTGYGYNHNNYFFNNTGYNANPWTFEQTFSNNPNHNFQSNENVNSYTNTHTQFSRNDHSTHSTSNIHLNHREPDSTGLTSLWDLIDDIEKQTTTDNGTDSSHSNNEKKEHIASNGDSDITQHFNENSFNTEDKTVPTTTQTKIEKTTIKEDNLRPHELERGDIGPEKLRPQEEVGRGDIGPDDSSIDNSNALNLKPLEIQQKNSTLYKRPEEIETLSLYKETNKNTFVNTSSTDENQSNIQKHNEQQDSNLSVTSLGENPLQHHFEQENWRLQSDIPRTTTTTPKSSFHYAYTSFNVEQGPTSLEQQNTDQHFENSGQQVEHNYDQFEGFNQQSKSKKNIEHKLVDFGQQSEHLGQEHVEQQFDNFDQQTVNLDQHNIDYHVANIEHDPNEIHQQNTDQQKLDTLEQQNVNLNQQSFNQFDYLGQQSENLGQEQQQSDNFGQQSEGFYQENINDFGQHEQFQQESLSEFEHPHENLNHPQKEQQLENWGQQSENLDSNIESEDLLKPTKDLQQQIQQVESYVLPSPYHKEDKELRVREPIVEPEILTQKSTNVNTPPEPGTETVGFWNKVGSKFVSAKDKVKSWFSSS